MTPSRRAPRLACSILALSAAWAAQAHDLWLERDESGLLLRYGHVAASPDEHHHASGPSREAGPPYDPAIVLRVDCFDRNGQPHACSPQLTSPLRIECDCAITHVLTSSGYWTKTPYGTQNVPKDQAEMAIRSWLSYESVKRIDAWSDALAAALTPDLEIVPLSNPLDLEPGDKLRMQISFEGKPVEGAVVSYDGKPRGKSDAEGRVNVRLRHEGLQHLQASLTRPLDSAQADEVIRSAVLNFELEAEE